MVDRSGRLPLEVAVGVQPPPHWAQIEAYGDEHRLVAEAARWGRTWTRPAIASDSIEWDSFNVVPRYVGSESTACFAALQPGWSQDEGAEEFDRFQESAARRGETALIISTIGDPEVQPTRSVFGGDGASIGLPQLHGSISGRRLPQGGVPEVAAGLSTADRDLALRVRDTNDVWWALELTETRWERGDGTGSGVNKPGGTIHPLLVNHLGEIVAGIWIPPDRDWRWYVVPGGTQWETLIAWAVDQAAPAFVPSALRRARSADLIDDELLTPAEVAARLALGAFDHEAAATRARLESDLTRATDDANAVRHDLLFGTGDVLKNVVASILRGAGLVVEDLDNTFGSGRSSDLLVTAGEVNCLVEVRSAAGMPGEAQIDDLDRHMRTWAALGRMETLHRTAFVINHQHALSPLSRKPRAYERQEFVDSLHHTVIPSTARHIAGPRRCPYGGRRRSPDGHRYSTHGGRTLTTDGSSTRSSADRSAHTLSTWRARRRSRQQHALHRSPPVARMCLRSHERGGGDRGDCQAGPLCAACPRDCRGGGRREWNQIVAPLPDEVGQFLLCGRRPAAQDRGRHCARRSAPVSTTDQLDGHHDGVAEEGHTCEA